MADPMRIMKRHDTVNPITGQVTTSTGPVDLTVFQTVKFQGKGTISGTPTLIGGTVTTRNADGTWSYQQVDADVSQAGSFSCEIECTMSNGRKVHFPNEYADNPILQIDQDLDNL